MNWTMDLKTFIKKNLLFVAIIIFVTLFMYVFGSENVLIGVMMITAALMMLSKNLTGKPFKSLAGLIGINVTLGVGSCFAYLNPWRGLVTNFTVVFIVTFVLMHDIKSPVQFPFLLGYAFILAFPVPVEEFPLRLLSLIVGSIFIVVLNVVVNRNRLAMSCHAGISGLFSEIKSLLEKFLNGEEVNSNTLIEKAKLVNSAVYDRLEEKYYTSPGSRSAINLAISAEELGKAVIDGDDEEQDLRDLLPVLDDLISYQELKIPLEQVHNSIMQYLDNHRSADYEVLSSLRIIDYELDILVKSDKESLIKYTDSEQIPKSFRMKTLFKENFRRDSLKFSFAFRVALLLALWEFIGDYYNLENAKWLAFTTVAVVQPYLEATASKSLMRVKGTLVGVAIFTVLAYFILIENPSLTPAVLMIISYLYSILDPKRYDVMMVFITLMALMTASMVFPTETSIIERLVYILLGIGAAMVGSRIIFPYRLKDENIELSGRYISISKSQIRELRNVASGTVDDVKSAALTLTAHTIAEKIKVNNDQDNDDLVDRLMTKQTEVTNQCSILRQILISTPDDGSVKDTKKMVVKVIDTFGSNGKESIPKDISPFLDGLTTHGSEYMKMVLNVLRLQRESENMFIELTSHNEDTPTINAVAA